MIGEGVVIENKQKTVHEIAKHKLYSSVLKNCNGEIAALKSISD
jgi:hypothetical protein